MTEYQINNAAALWLKGKDTMQIAQEVCPRWNDVNGYSRGGEADVYNNIGRIKQAAATIIKRRA